MPIRNLFQFGLLLSLTACSADQNPVHYAASIPPVGMIVEVLAAGRAEVHVLLPPGASPHTHDARPSDARDAETARALIFAGETIDGWAAAIANDAAISINKLLESAHPVEGVQPLTTTNPHFWVDPLTVKSLVPLLADRLAALDPDGAVIYQKNAEEFAALLDDLHTEIDSLLSPYRGRAVIQAHASWDAFLERYGIVAEGVLEPTPGAEPTPRHFARLVDAVNEGRVAAIITEPQLPRAPVESLAAEGKARIVELDPVGGVDGRNSYVELMRFNARQLAEALQ